jgi:hypothetical protein
MTRLRRSRLAGALVALGILFYPAGAGLLFQRIVRLLMICATSFADSAPLGPGEQICATHRRSRAGKVASVSEITTGFS